MGKKRWLVMNADRGVNRCPEMLFYVYYTRSAVLDLLSVFGRSPGLMALHNSAQFCTIFLTDFLPFPPSAGAV